MGVDVGGEEAVAVVHQPVTVAYAEEVALVGAFGAVILKSLSGGLALNLCLPAIPWRGTLALLAADMFEGDFVAIVSLQDKAFRAVFANAPGDEHEGAVIARPHTFDDHFP